MMDSQEQLEWHFEGGWGCFFARIVVCYRETGAHRCRLSLPEREGVMAVGSCFYSFCSTVRTDVTVGK